MSIQRCLGRKYSHASAPVKDGRVRLPTATVPVHWSPGEHEGVRPRRDQWQRHPEFWPLALLLSWLGHVPLLLSYSYAPPSFPPPFFPPRSLSITILFRTVLGSQQKVQTFCIYPLPPHALNFPTIDIPHQSAFITAELHGHIRIIQCPQFMLGLTLAGRSACFDKCVMTCTHPYSIVQSTFPVPKSHGFTSLLILSQPLVFLPL